MQNRTKIFFIILAVVAVGGFAYAGYRFANRKPDVSQGIVCTQEALLCPDGSYVARSGPECKFRACPNQLSFTGILRQNNSGFFLIFDSPETSGDGGVAYAMPLILKDSNVAGQLVGQKVRVSGVFVDGVTLSVDRLEELRGDAGDPTLGEVGVGKSVFINGVRVTLNKIVQDSRCPVDVQCIQAGWVTANVTLRSDTDNETRDIASNVASVAFDSFKISIENIKPSRIAGLALEPESYLITFRVRAN